MIYLETLEAHAAPAELSHEEINEILTRPDGPFTLLEMVRRGRIDGETAVRAIDKSIREPFLKRLFVALVDTIFRK
jgi:hypothetical protein